jgi:hypothetical protein
MGKEREQEGEEILKVAQKGSTASHWWIFFGTLSTRNLVCRLNAMEAEP